MTQYPPAIFVMGPTAAGKTDLAMRLCDALPCDIISVDSALIYKGMDIGTAKPSAEELVRYPHRLVDILDPAEAYSAARFCDDALAAMAEISANGRIPLLVGGTMLYYRALQKGLADLPEADPTVRARLDAEALENGWPAMHARLAEIDPEAAARIKPTDPQRIQRALEVHALAGVTMSELYARQSSYVLPYHVAKLVISSPERSVLHERIERRFRLMLAQGFIDEVKQLRARGDLSLELPSMRAVGYRQVWEYLEGLYDFDTMVDKGVVATRQFAKRQLTWLRAEQEVCWFDGADAELPAKALNYIDGVIS